MKLNRILLIYLIFCTGILYGQEICDNGIDDNGNGLIDLNDDECICDAFIQSSLIPNPSFEEMVCCPTENAMLNCANNWIQASEPTTDYVHTCGNFLSNAGIDGDAPLPFPDGEGGVGFRDGHDNGGQNYKEYVGACLTETMIIGTTYRIDFFVGFMDNIPGSGELEIAIFGSVDCGNLPFGGNSTTIGCPVNTGTYSQLAIQDVSGSNEWVNVVVEFVADKAYEVLILGPGCATNPNFAQQPYFFLDRLALEEAEKFGVPFDDISGNICQNDLVLSIDDQPGNTYQWFKDGIAIVGETGSSLSLSLLNDTDGKYLVAISNGGLCELSKEYELKIPPYYSTVSTNICENESFDIEGNLFTESGYYEQTIPASDGCDSIVQLTLEVNANSFAFISDTFCTGDSVRYYGSTFMEAGIYDFTIPNSAGCDSIIQLELNEVTPSQGAELESPMEIFLGEQIDIIPANLSLDVQDFFWYNNSDSIISEAINIYEYRPFQSTSLFLETVNEQGCSTIDSLEIIVDNSNINILVPTAFSPDGNGINDFFRFFSTIALEQVEIFVVYDRWGNKVYEERNIPGSTNFQGWDGTYKLEPSEIGVYCFYLTATFIDGSTEMISGNVTLIR